jgi:hypothetical protein
LTVEIPNVLIYEKFEDQFCSVGPERDLEDVSCILTISTPSKVLNLKVDWCPKDPFEEDEEEESDQDENQDQNSQDDTKSPETKQREKDVISIIKLIQEECVVGSKSETLKS